MITCTIQPPAHPIALRALSFAINAHADQKRWDGSPFITHPLAVAERFRDDPELFCIAILHDVCEDCGVSREEIVSLCGERVAAGVAALTRGAAESWNAYLRRVKENPDARLIKPADIAHNLPTASPSRRLLYEKALLFLQA